MRVRTSLLIVALVAVVVAIPLHFVNRRERAAEAPAEEGAAAQTQVGDVDAREVYCARRTEADAVIVNTGAGCANRSDSADPHSPTLTITRGPDAIVITGSDP